MQNKNWEQVKQLLQQVLTLEAVKRNDFLNASAVEPEIRAEVESLLAYEEASENLMNLSAIEFSGNFFDEETENSLVGQNVGAYKIVREIGHGGMGAVYLAERADGKFAQKVALKLLKREMNTSALRRRFQQEREILASLNHPNIARLLDAGATNDKIPFIAMEYVDGLPIDDYCRRHDLDLTDILELFRKVCATVTFAHQNLVVHRDLKPSNILVTTDGTPKLLDFGISKILVSESENADAATVTRIGAMTPGYASPEQLRNESVTTATDIYSLGVILYELLSGHRPFESQENDLKAIYKAVLEIEPPPPSALLSPKSKVRSPKSEDHVSQSADLALKSEAVTYKSVVDNPKSQTAVSSVKLTNPQSSFRSPQLKGDLDNIVLKALRKEPERRYSSAENFSEDVRRHLEGLPVTARPNTFKYRAEKFIKRNTFAVGAAALILLAIFGGMAATLWQARIAQTERTRAEKRFNDVRKLANSFLFEFSPKIENLPGSTPARQLLVTRALEYLDGLSQEAGDDLGLRRELAKAYEKVGDVQGNPSNPNIGDVKGALLSYDKSLNIRQTLLENEPDDSLLSADLARNFELIGDIHTNGGDYSKSAEFFDKAVAIRQQIVGRNPSDYQTRANLAKTLRSRGLIPFYNGEYKKSLEYYERVREMYEKLREENPVDDTIGEEFAYTIVMIGEAQGWDGELELAGQNIQKGIELLVPLAANHPNNHGFQRSLNLAYSKKGENYEDLNDINNAIIYYNKALEIAEKSLKADPQSVQSKRDVALGYKKLAGALDTNGKSLESLDKFNHALKLFQELCAADASNTEYPYDVANTRFSIGETYLTLKDYNSALETLQLAKGEFESVLKTNPTDMYAIRTSAFNLDRIGKSYTELAEKSNRREFLQKALEIKLVAFEGLNKLKTEGSLGDAHSEELATIEREIEEIKTKISTS